MKQWQRGKVTRVDDVLAQLEDARPTTPVVMEAIRDCGHTFVNIEIKYDEHNGVFVIYPLEEV